MSRIKMLDKISVLILTYNEAANIQRQLNSLQDFASIVVVDSCSDDGTAEIVSRFPNARLVTHPFDDHASQWNYGLSECDPDRPWVLALDADYLLPPELIGEISALRPESGQVGYRTSFRYCIYGRALSGSLYPSHTVLFRRDRARYIQGGHTQRLVIDGLIGDLSTPIDHDDRKSLTRWLSSQIKYAELEVEYLLSAPKASFRTMDRFRYTGVFSPIAVALYTLFVKRCVLDGWRGWLYVLQRLIAELIICAMLVDRRVSKNVSSDERIVDEAYRSQP